MTFVFLILYEFLSFIFIAFKVPNKRLIPSRLMLYSKVCANVIIDESFFVSTHEYAYLLIKV